VFTEQHYKELARMIKNNIDYYGFINDLIDTFKLDNPKFDEAKFRKAIRWSE
jgi:hypothetical protein